MDDFQTHFSECSESAKSAKPTSRGEGGKFDISYKQ